jgi:peptide-methionine (S)-S-oxide reductase
MALQDRSYGGSPLFPEEFPEPAIDVPAGSGEAQTAVFGGGCFWCVEAVFQPLEGVLDVHSGYAGGTKETADYRTVCSGATDHAEVVQVRFDPNRITYGQLLKVFFSVAHDPTQLNRQGADRGRQYRSVVFYLDETQKQAAESYIRQLEEAGAFNAPIVTEVAPLVEYYPGEEYHQDYASRNPFQPYIASVSAPKVAKLRKHFAERLRD